MKKLGNLKDVNTLNRMEQKRIIGGDAGECYYYTGCSSHCVQQVLINQAFVWVCNNCCVAQEMQ